MPKIIFDFATKEDMEEWKAQSMWDVEQPVNEGVDYEEDERMPEVNMTITEEE